jgi:hypothetical protein
VSSASIGGSSSKRPLVIVLAVIGVVAVVLGVLWFAGAAPSFLNVGSHVKHGGHLIRGGTAVVVGVAALVYAWFLNKKSR